MEKTYLIQRLKAPRGRINPHSFGGGLRNGGLSDRAARSLADVWDFAYMGDGRYENGSVQRALEKIFDYSLRGEAAAGNLTLKKEVFYLCQNSDREEIEKRIRTIGTVKHFRDDSFLKEHLEGKPAGRDYCGWLELNNGFMFFTNEEMFKGALKLFGVV